MFTLIPSPTCPHCREAVLDDAEVVVCEACLATHHAGCWHEAGGCQAFGQARPPARPRPQPPRVRARSTSRRQEAGGEDRRRLLLHSLAHREELDEDSAAKGAGPQRGPRPPRHDRSPRSRPPRDLEDEDEGAPVYQRPNLLARTGEVRECRKCHEEFVVRSGEETCSRCTTSWWIKAGLVVAAVVIWQVVF